MRPRADPDPALLVRAGPADAPEIAYGDQGAAQGRDGWISLALLSPDTPPAKGFVVLRVSDTDVGMPGA